MSIARRMSVCAAGALLLLTTTAYAQEAFTSQVANVRAGPDRSYPLVSQLGAGAPVRVEGCLDDWSWCDVSFDDNRGWVYAPFLLYGVQDDRVPLYTYGPSLGIAIVGFSLGTYWDEHYRRRPWYGSREEWSRRAPPEHHAPTGLPPHATYTPGMHVDRGGHTAPAASHAGRSREPQAPARAAPAQEREAPKGNEHVAPTPPARAHPAPESTRGAPPSGERGAPAPRAPERSAAPPPAREPPAQERHVPERPQPEGGAKGGERGGEKKPEEEKR